MCVRAYMCVYMYAYGCVWFCTCIRACKYACVCVRRHVRACIWLCVVVYACVRVCVCARVHVCVGACVCERARVYVYVRVRACVCVCLDMFASAWGGNKRVHAGKHEAYRTPMLFKLTGLSGVNVNVTTPHRLSAVHRLRLCKCAAVRVRNRIAACRRN